MRRLNRRGRGFTMPEMLVALGLLTAFALISSRLFTASMRAVAESRRAETAMAAFENALGRMRADVWGAEEVLAGKDGGLVLHRGDGVEVAWGVSPGNGVMTRNEVVDGKPGRATSWDAVPAGVTFAVVGPAVTVRVPDGRTGVAEIVLVSQVRMARDGGGGK